MWLKCVDCSTEFPVFIFSGDTDMATDALRTSTDIKAKALFIYERSEQRPGGCEVQLVDVVRAQPIQGESFQEYQKRANNTRERYYYKCINCNVGKAESIQKLSEQELLSRGYRLILNKRNLGS